MLRLSIERARRDGRDTFTSDWHVSDLQDARDTVASLVSTPRFMGAELRDASGTLLAFWNDAGALQCIAVGLE